MENKSLAGSSAWYEQSPYKALVGGSNPPRPTI